MSRSKPQEWPPHPKSAEPLSSHQNQNVSMDKTVAEISMKDFLDFLKISYQVNESIDNPSSDITEKTSVNWKKLTSDALIYRLKEREALISKEKLEKAKAESVEKSIDTTPIRKTRENGTLTDTEVPNKKLSRQKFEEQLLGSSSSYEKLNQTNSQPPQRFPSSISLEDKLVAEKAKRPPLGRKKSLKKESSADSETSRSLDAADDPAKLLKKKLTEVLQEGILDSVMPYLLPKQPVTQENSQAHLKKPLPNDAKKPTGGNVEKNEKSQLIPNVKEKFETKKKLFGKNDIVDKYDKKDTEIVIHVCDEIKNLKRDFKCSQKLLVSQMGYFAEVTTGQKLEDMDISVHCDVTIFEWLMRWVQKDKNEKNWPVLDSSIVIPVLMSSAFLQMQSLQDHCLQYCKDHVNEIIVHSSNLGCLNDNVLSRLVNLFSNLEVENIVDKKDKIQSKAFCKLILALSQPEPQPQRGHFSSLTTLYRCSKCLKLILRNMSTAVLCVASNMKMDWNGTIHSTHVYDSSWTLTDYIKDLKAELKSWRKVYWRLWGNCHFLFCQACEEYFPVHQISWCRFHTEPVQYFTPDTQKSVHNGIGRHPCCKERTFRFEVAKKNSGCQYRDHFVSARTTAEVEILRLCNILGHLVKEDPPPIPQTDRKKIVRTSSEENGSKKNLWRDGFWWDGIQLVPLRQPTGLLHKIWDNVVKRDELKNAGINSEYKGQKSSAVKFLTQQPSIQDMSSLSDSSDESSSSSNAGNSEESYHHSTKVLSKSKTSSSTYSISNRLIYLRKEKKRKKKKKKQNLSEKNDCNRFWLTRLSTRSNQDNQREFEERALRQIESLLAKKLSGESLRGPGSRSSYQVVPAGGIYVKLEQEWREAYCFSHGCPGSSVKLRGSSSFVSVGNSTASAQKRSKSKGHR